MLIIAAGGLAINLISLRVLSGGKNESPNVRGTWLHVLADALGSIGAICSALLIVALDWKWADPLASVLTACPVIYLTGGTAPAAALLLFKILPVFLVVAPCIRGVALRNLDDLF